MRRNKAEQADVGEDSFLDVVANVVGVLIILVMLIGVRASQTVVALPESAVATSNESVPPQEPLLDERSEEELTAEIEEVSRHVQAANRRLKKSMVKIVNLGYQAKLQDKHRLELAAHSSEMQEELERRREALSADSQQKFDVQNKIFNAKLELDELSDQQLTLLNTPSHVEEIEIEATPVARRVDEEATHLRLLKGNVCRVPFYELLEAMEYERASIQRELSNTQRVNRMVGPIGGFRLRLKTRQVIANQAVTGPLVGQSRTRGAFIPFYYFDAGSNQLGEQIDQAMLPTSNLRSTLVDARRKSPVIVVWVYNDSFDEFRTLKKLLSEMSFSVATYTLPVGTPIQASPLGTETRVQ